MKPNTRSEGFILGVISGAFLATSILQHTVVEGYIWMVLVLILGVATVVKPK